MPNTTTTDFSSLMDGFGIVTVMNVKLYSLKKAEDVEGDAKVPSYTDNSEGLTPADFNTAKTAVDYIDTLKIANLTMEGPTKTITGGQYANPLIKYGKTMTMEMQDALGRKSTLEKFFGCEVLNDVISVRGKFPGAFAIEGQTFFIDQATGDEVPVYIFIPQFLPDGLLNLTQDAEGDATVFDLNGSVSVTKIKESSEAEPKDVFYQIRKTPFFPAAT